ncbi:histidine phosphatase family protein [Castellaniella caeni]
MSVVAATIGPVTTCLLVRHGHVEGIEPKRFRGRAELPLTELGRRQAAALRDRIAREWTPDAVYTSALSRCVDTGALIGAPHGLEPQQAAGLLDIDYGQWQGLTEDEAHARWPDAWARWHEQPQTAEIPGGETLKGLAQRSLNALEGLLLRHQGQTIVVVAHDSVNRVLLLHALGLSLARYWSIRQTPCTLNVLDVVCGQLQVRTLNETGHTFGL